MRVDESEVADLLSWASGSSRGADFYAQVRRTLRVAWEKGGPSEASAGIDEGVGLRYRSGDTDRYAWCDGLSPSRLARLLRRPAETPTAGATALPRASSSTEALEALEPLESPSEWSELLAAAESVSLRNGPPGAEFSAVVHRTRERIWSARTGEPLVSEERFRGVAYLRVVARRGGRVSQASRVVAAGGTPGSCLARLEAAADQAAESAHLQGEGGSAPQGDLPVVLGPWAAGVVLHGVVGHLLEGDRAADGSSPFAGRIGESVGPDWLHLVEEGPEEADGLGGLDDEGQVVREWPLIEGGLLRGFLTDGATAARLGLPPSGHARRESYRHPCLPRMRRLALRSADPSRALEEGLDFGLWVTRVGGGRAARGGTGVAFPVTEGFLVRNGRAAEPVRGAVLRGTPLEWLSGLEAAGDETEKTLGVSLKAGQSVAVSERMPALRFRRLNVLGVETC